MLFLANATKIDVSYSALSQTKPDIICYRKGELKLVWNQLIIQCISFPLLLPVWTQLQSHAQPSDSYVLLAQNVTSSSNLLIITSLYICYWLNFECSSKILNFKYTDFRLIHSFSPALTQMCFAPFSGLNVSCLQNPLIFPCFGF